MSVKGMQVVFNNVGINDHLPYSKADFIKVSRVSDNISISFYQLDYQAMAVGFGANKPSTDVVQQVKDGSAYLISVGKIVLDKNGFQQLITEIEHLKKAMADDK